MYAKLFSRITESSIMEEPIEVRYCFVMLLAMCDPTGHVIGTDVAISRRMNMPGRQFSECIAALMLPDPNSNSKEEDGKRVVISECERGYRIVNYLTYRDMRDEEQRREYMRSYMRKYRGGKLLLTPVNTGKHSLAHAEAEAEEEYTHTGASASKPEAVIPTEAEIIAHGQKILAPADWCRTYHAKKTEQGIWLNQYGKLIDWRKQMVRYWAEDRGKPQHGTRKQNSGRSSRNDGTASEGRSAEYANVGKVT